jgi:hypothetical protein
VVRRTEHARHVIWACNACADGAGRVGALMADRSTGSGDLVGTFVVCRSFGAVSTIRA